MLLDTNIFIDFFKGNKEAEKFIGNNQKGLAISPIVSMEIVKGLGKKQDIRKFEKFLKNAGIRTEHITKTISQRAYHVFTGHFHRINIGIYDALLAATAIQTNKQLVTRNIKHFEGIKELNLLKPY